MKKFTLLMGAALVAMSANATLYITGDGVPGSNWAPKTPMVVELENGEYTFTLTSGTFKISTTTGAGAAGDGWAQFNTGARQIDGAWETDLTAGAALAALKPGDQNITKPDTHIVGEVTYTVDAALENILAEFTPTEVDPNEIPAMYLVGGPAGWSKNESYRMSSTDGVTYTLTTEIAKGAEFKFFGGEWGTREFTQGQNLADGTYDMWTSDANMSLATGGTITFTLVQSNNFSSAKLTITGQGGGDVPPTPSDKNIYLAGNFNGFNPSDADYKFVKDGDVYVLSLDSWEEGNNFKVVSDGSWLGTTTPVKSGVEYELGDTGTVNSTFAFAPKAGVVFNFNPETKTLVAEYEFDAPAVTAIYMRGSMNGWAVSDDYKFATEDGVTYTLTTNIPEDGTEFKLDVKFDNDTEDWIANGGEFGNGTFTLVGNNDANMKLLAHGDDVTFTLVLSDNFAVDETMTMIITGLPALDIPRPEAMYIIGAINGGVWSAADGLKMEETTNGFSATFNTISDSMMEEYVTFGFTTQLAENADGYDSIAEYRYGASEDQTLVVNGETISFLKGTNAFMIPVNSEVQIELNWVEQTITASISTGVESVMIENGEAVYFNLQGQRVANPENGLFIRVQNGKAVKVVK